MSENTGSSKKRKVLSATLAVAMVGTMLLSGTLAYFYQSKAVNTFRGTEKVAYGHDDFHLGENKDVYVENAGGTAIYVRIKFTENLETSDATIGNIGTEATPVVHSFKEGALTNTTDEEANKKLREHFVWTMGGAATPYLKVKGNEDLFNAAETADAIEADEDKVYMTGEGAGNVAPGKVAHDDLGNGVKTTDAVTGTTPASVVITMDEWKNLAYQATAEQQEAPDYDPQKYQKTFLGWVADKDGWYYWSQQVPSGETTGLLLDNVQVKDVTPLSVQDFTYNINVNFEVVDDDDMGLWTTADRVKDATGAHVGNHAASADAIKLLGIAQGSKSKAGMLTEKANDPSINAPARAVYAQALQAQAEKKYSKAATIEEAGDNLRDHPIEDPDTPLIDLNNLSAGPITDTVLATYLVNTYGDPTAKTLTKGQAASVVEVSIADGSQVGSLTGIKWSDFPSLMVIKLEGQKNMTSFDLGSSGDEDSKKLKNNIRSITFTHSTLTSLNLSGYGNLESLNVAGWKSLETVTNMPASLQALSCQNCSNWTIDFTNNNLKNLVYISLTGDTSNPDKLKNLTNLKVVDVAVLNTDVTIDVSGCSNLIWLRAEEYSYYNSSYTGKALDVILPQNAWNVDYTYTTCPINDWQGGVFRPDLALFGCDKKTLDISMYKLNWENCSGLSKCRQLQGVTRRADQYPFKDYPAGEDRKVYERILQADGATYEYKVHVNGDVEGRAPTAEELNYINANSSTIFGTPAA